MRAPAVVAESDAGHRETHKSATRSRELYVNALFVACEEGSSAYGKPETAPVSHRPSLPAPDLRPKKLSPSRGRSHFRSQLTETDVVELVLLKQLHGQEQQPVDDVPNGAPDGLSARSGTKIQITEFGINADRL